MPGHRPDRPLERSKRSSGRRDRVVLAVSADGSD